MGRKDYGLLLLQSLGSACLDLFFQRAGSFSCVNGTVEDFLPIVGLSCPAFVRSLVLADSQCALACEANIEAIKGGRMKDADAEIHKWSG